MNYNKIEEIREYRKLPKMEFYKLLDLTDSGFRRSIERHSLRVDILEKIAEILGVPVVLFFDTPTESKEIFSAEDLKNLLAMKIPAEDKVNLLGEVVKLLSVTTEAQKQKIIGYEAEIEILKDKSDIS